jgi:putative transposase
VLRLVGDFVERVFAQADERLKSKYFLKAQGYDFDKVVQRVAELLDMPEDEVTSPGKRRSVVKARSLVCYWAHRELGMSQTELAGKFSVSQPAVSAAVQNGQKIVQEHQYNLIN